MSEEKWELFKEESRKDESLSEVISLTQEGWPNERSQCAVLCKQYWNIRGELCVVDGVLYKGEKVVLPKSLRKAMLQKIHESHLGVVKSKSRAREILYWPNIRAGATGR